MNVTEERYGEELARRFAAWADGAGLLSDSTEDQVATLAKAYIAGAMSERAAWTWTHPLEHAPGL